MEELKNTKSKNKSRTVRRAAAVGIAAFALAALALLALFSGKGVSSGTLSGIVIAGQSSQSEEREPFSYETGSMQTFARAGEGIAVASTSSAQLINSVGTTVCKQICSFSAPAVSASSSSALFFDVGGTGCILMRFDGTSADIVPAGEIISAAINGSGYYAIITEQAGYKGLVSVYDSEGTLLYEWYSGEGYAIKACVSPDNKHLAVLCAEETGSAVHIFALTSAAEKAKARYEGKLLFDMEFMNASTICALGENGIYFADVDGAKTTAQEFENWYLCDYCLHSGEQAVLYLSRYRTGTEGTLFTVDSSGKVLGKLAIDREVLSVSSNGRSVLVMTSSSLEKYSSSLALQASYEHLMTAKRAFLRRDGSVLLMSSYYADVYIFD